MKRITYPDGHHEDYPDVIAFTPPGTAGAVRRYEVFVDGRSLGLNDGRMGLPEGQFSIFRAWADSYSNQPCGPTAVQLQAFDASSNPSPLSMPLNVFFPEYQHCPPPHADC